MPGINVSALSGGDLRRLLKVAHARRDGLLADRLEWEVAARATNGGRPPAAFASHPDDDEDEPVERIAAAFEPAPGVPDDGAREPAQASRGVVLVTLGAVVGSLLSATVFWGLERMDLRRTPGQAESATAAALPAPDPARMQPEAPAARIETALSAAAPSVDARQARAKRHAAARAPRKPVTLAVARAEQAPRPPNLAEWLASEPDEPIR
jgi:hypothetical protein